jgi:hypothetical protein
MMFGVHPHFSSTFDETARESLENLLNRKRV